MYATFLTRQMFFSFFCHPQESFFHIFVEQSINGNPYLMIIHSAKYHNGCTSLEKCPQSTLPEFAFIGRSNVGKSSLINLLTGNGKLAMTSHQPGKTILINHYLINEKWFLVDLPGYGYARRAKTETAKFARMIYGYIDGRTTLHNLFVLIDSNIPPQKIDLEFIQWLGEHGVPFNIIFTKVDKQSRSAAAKNITAFNKTLLETWEELPQHFMTSSTKKTGREEVLDYIDHLLKTTCE